ncbi:MAG TPA: fibronectin type III domain-containing protein [Spirochaetota bacterium]|nr:fibronectin type III domain-containing protein [Spirochaetota bacterium]HOD14247.1 fibronectin type III domain-containing protein [Spirochaetota bacterium]HPG50683.1 fibronectin type III domain-containing protein [Spirochaetota bacterium]HPN12872.1 fibronectin type III domain-containing protein [Spirochaetota bacterium]
MKRMAGAAGLLCAAVAITAAATVPATADYVFYKNGRVIEGEMLITPSVLQFKMTASSVDIFWAPPSFPVKSYLVYLRRGAGEFVFAGETSRPRMRLEGLECSTEYTVHVTSIDGNNHESSPSSDIRFVTFAGTPRPPARLRIAGITPDGTGYAARLVWEKAEDTCGGPVKEYCVYVRSSADTRAGDNKENKKPARRGAAPPERFPGFRLAGRTAGTAFRLEGLGEHVRYTIMVTSIDALKNESGTSTLSFTPAPGAPQPANRRPGDPFPAGCRMIAGKDGLENTARIYWKAARDQDGYISSYRVYRKAGRTYELAGTTQRTDFEVRGLPAAGVRTFVVRSVDDLGAESRDSITVATGLTCPLTVTARTVFLFPLGDFGRFFRPGYGGLIHAGVGFYRFSLGAEAGYLRCAGKTDRIAESSMTPFALVASYEIPLARWLYVVPGLAFGGCRADARSAPLKTPFIRIPLYENRVAVEPMIGAGLAFIFMPFDMIVAEARFEYRGMIEKKGLAGFISISAGAGARFDLR